MSTNPPRVINYRVEILFEDYPKITRPLALIEKSAYAVAWLPVKLQVTTTPPGKAKGKDRYEETTVWSFVIRDDGKIFRPDGKVYDDAADMEELGIEVKLNSTPPKGKTWSPTGGKYRLDCVNSK